MIAELEQASTVAALPQHAGDGAADRRRRAGADRSRGGHYRSDFPDADPAWRHRTFIDARRCRPDRRPATGASKRRGMSESAPVEAEAPPLTGWARLAPELLVTDLAASLAFWSGRLGFRDAYAREGFVYLERVEGAQLMLCERDGTFENGADARPFGRGVMFQV